VSEIDFAGHPTLGTAFVIKKYLEHPDIDKVNLGLAVGRLSVTTEDNLYWMDQNQPKFGKEIPVNEISGVLGIDESDIDRQFPVLETTTGLPFTIVPLKNLDAVRKARIDPQKYSNFITNTWAKGILVFSSEAYEHDQHLSARVFVHYLGIPEDPATGSAAGCLSAYLLKTGYFGNKRLELNIGQGYEIRRPSLIKISAEKNETQFEIKVGGRVTEIAAGIWNTN